MLGINKLWQFPSATQFFIRFAKFFLLCADFTDLYQISEFYLRFQMRITIWWHFWLSRKPFNGILPNNWSWVTTDEHLIDIIWNALLANGLNSELNGSIHVFRQFLFELTPSAGICTWNSPCVNCQNTSKRLILVKGKKNDFLERKRHFIKQ